MLNAVMMCACADGAPTFDSPWEGVASSEEVLTGSFRAEVGQALPGRGTFTVGDMEARDGARVQVLEVEGAAEKTTIKI